MKRSILFLGLILILGYHPGLTAQQNDQSRIFRTEILNAPELKAQRDLAWRLLGEGQLDSAIEVSTQYFQQANSSTSPPEQMVNACSHMAQILARMGSRKAAAQYFNQALVLYHQYNFKPSVFEAGLYGSMAGMALHVSKDTLKAMQCYKKDLALREQYGTPLFISSIQNNIGILFLKEGVLDSAAIYFDKAESLLRKNGIRQDNLVFSIINNLGLLSLQKGEYEKAFAYFDSNAVHAHQIFDSFPDKRFRLLTSAIGKSKALLGMNLPDSAAFYVTQAESNIQYVKFKLKLQIRIELLELKAELYRRNNDVDNLAKVQEVKEVYLDSLRDIEMEATTLVSQNMLDMQSQMSSLKLRNKQQQVDFNRLLIISFIITFIIATIFFSILWRKRGIQLRTQQELSETQLKNEELRREKMALEIETKNRDLDGLTAHTTLLRMLTKEAREKLKSLTKLDNNDQRAELQSLFIKLTQNINNYKVGEFIQTNTKEISSSFFVQLDELASEKLTKKERELCALFRLNLSDEQVSDMRGITRNAVRVARHRIKKKFNLGKKDNLDTFLAQIKTYSPNK